MKKLIIFIVSIFCLMNLTHAEEAENIVGDGNTYIYYYGQGCTHCAKLDTYLQKTDAYNRLNIEKKEVYFDNDNRDEMLQACTRMGINESASGVPFFMVTTGSGEELALFGDTDIINYVSPYLGDIEDFDTGNNNRTIVLVILGLLAVIIPVTIINLTNKK